MRRASSCRQSCAKRRMRRLCRRHGLIRTPEPLSFAEIVAAVPQGGTLVLPVLTEIEAFTFVITEGVEQPAVIGLHRIDHKRVVEHLLLAIIDPPTKDPRQNLHARRLLSYIGGVGTYRQKCNESPPRTTTASR